MTRNGRQRIKEGPGYSPPLALAHHLLLCSHVFSDKHCLRPCAPRLLYSQVSNYEAGTSRDNYEKREDSVGGFGRKAKSFIKCKR